MKNALMTMLLTSALLLPAAAVSAASVAMTRTDVKMIQQELKDYGFYRAGVDGIWGPKTDAAMRHFQASNGIAPTGRFDLATAEQLGIPVVVYGQPVTTVRYINARPLPGTYVATTDMTAEDLNLRLEPAAGTPTMRAATSTYYVVPVAAPLGESETQALQQALRDSGYFTKEPVNGMWTPYTITALRSYQIDKGLAGTGFPDLGTLQRLGLQIQSSDKLMTSTTTAR